MRSWSLGLEMAAADIASAWGDNVFKEDSALEGGLNIKMPDPLQRKLTRRLDFTRFSS